jgi:heme/copper-type cytochrome/quinol oxidase subunit 3
LSQAFPASVRTAGEEPDPRALETQHSRTTLLGGRMMLSANLTLQSTFLFAYLYLRANNFGGMWRPSGVGAPALSTDTIVLAIPVVGVVVFWAAAQAAGTGERQPMTRALGLALLFACATVAIRVYQMYQTGWDLSQGTYVDTSVIWFAVLLAEFVIAALWTLSIYMGHVRRTVAASRAQVKSLFEYWAFVTGLAAFVYILVQFVT